MHTARMNKLFDNRLWNEIKQERRRVFAIFFGFACFWLLSPLLTSPDHHLALGFGCAAYYIIVLLAPKSWFGRNRPWLVKNGPLPALRSQPPPPPTRSNTRHLPQREEPLPPLPEKPLHN